MPICGGRRLARPVHSWGGACPYWYNIGCQVGRATQLVGPAPAPHGALGGRQASTGASAFAQPTGGRMKAGWPLGLRGITGIPVYRGI